MENGNQNKLVCAPEDTSVLNYYQNSFSSVFICFSPFIKTVDIDPELFYPDTYPNDQEILKTCTPFNWQDFLGISKIESLNLLDIGLRSRILGLKKKYQREDVSEIITKISDDNRIIPPNEGAHSPFICSKFLNQLKVIGYSHVLLSDEFGENTNKLTIDEYLDSTHFGRRNVFTEDLKFLLTVHWDSHFSLLCFHDNFLVKKFISDMKFEGFLCDNKTEIYWSLRSPLQTTYNRV